MTTRLTVILAALILAACSEPASELSEETVDTRVADDTSTADTAADITPEDTATADTAVDSAPADTEPLPDAPQDAVEPTPIEGIPAGPQRSTALDTLYCGLDNEDLVRAALRAGACIEGASVASILDDAARGFVYGDMMRSGYFSRYYGNCDVLSCLAQADSCEAAIACDEARFREDCDGLVYHGRCDGDVLEQCIYDNDTERYRWHRLQDCTRMDATCVEVCDGPDCRPHASCQGDETTDACPDFYGACEGDSIIRCTEPNPDTNQLTQISIPCDELAPGGTCSMEAVGGEAPGPICRATNGVSCDNAFAEGFACDPESGALTLCLYGQEVVVSCQDFGYSTCDGDGFFDERCVP